MNDDLSQATRLEITGQLVGIALRVLSTRTLVLISLLLNTGVFVWAMSCATWLHLAGAATFAVTSWCTVNLQPPKGHEP
jgi:hypothetical protein